MSIRRTSRNFQKNFLKNNKNLKILDLGCSFENYWPEANHFADIDDHTKNFKSRGLSYTQIKPGEKLPFNNKEFDYVILSHVLEHVPNLLDFKNEVIRIGKAGYIELPTKLNDNMVFGCDEEIYGHKWWFEFDDDLNRLIYCKREQVLEKFLSVGSVWKLQKYYEDSLILQFYWENEFELFEREKFIIDEKISFFSLIKKFFSKKIRDKISKFKSK
jgi:SAM-dependent methyltransferase